MDTEAFRERVHRHLSDAMGPEMGDLAFSTIAPDVDQVVSLLIRLTPYVSCVHEIMLNGCELDSQVAHATLERAHVASVQ